MLTGSRLHRSRNRVDWYLIIYVLFFCIVSLLPLIVGEDNAKYVRIGLLVCVTVNFLWTNSLKITINRYTKFQILYAILIIFIAVGVFRNFNITNFEMLVLFIISFLIIGSQLKYTNSTLDAVNKILIISAILVSISVIFQFINPAPFSNLIKAYYPADRWRYFEQMVARGSYSGIFTEVSATCAYLVVALGLVFYTLNRNKKWKMLCLSIVFFALILTAKRAHMFFPIASFLIVYIILATGRKQISRMGKVIVIGSIVLLVAVGFLLNTEIPILYRYSELISNMLSGEDYSTGRTMIWRYVFQLISDHPIFGAGWGTCEEYVSKLMGSSVAIGAHNVFLQLWAEIGVFGLAAFIGMFISGLKLSIHSLRKCQMESYERGVNLLKFSIYYQVFFIIYCITGAPLVDRMYLIPYIISIVIAFQVDYVLRKGQI